MADFTITGFSEGTYSWREFLVSNIGSASGEYGIPFSLLPHVIAPVDKQVQLAVNQTLYSYWPFGTGSAPTNYYTVTPEEVVTSGVPCWGIRVVFTAVGTAEAAELRAWDHNGDLIPIEADWFDIAQDGTNDAVNGAKFLDADRTSHADDEAFDIRFPRQYSVSKVGWTDSDDASTDNYADTATISLNVGTWAAEVWSEMAALTGLDDTYPTWHATFDPDLDMLYASPADGSLTEGGTVGPYITLATPLTTATDAVMMWRETRGNQLWVQPQLGARFRGYDWYWLCRQILFAYQDAGEIGEIANRTESILWREGEYDYGQGNQVQHWLNHASTDAYVIDEITLLEGIPSELEDGDAQLIVELGEATDGTSTYWAVQTGWTYTAATDTVTLGAASANDVRIRRTTKIDALWYDSEDMDPNNFSIGVVRLMLTQLVFLSEEAMISPFFDPSSILGNTHFPRAWNWLRYVWSGADPPFGGPSWGGGGSATVWKNFVKVVDPTDYSLGPLTFRIRWVTDPSAGDVIDIRYGATLWDLFRHSGGDGAEGGDAWDRLEDPDDPVAGPGAGDLPPDGPISGYGRYQMQPLHCIILTNAGASTQTDLMLETGMVGANYLNNLANDYTFGLVFNMGRINLDNFETAHLSLCPCLQTAADWGQAGHYDGFIDYYKRGSWMAKDVSWDNYAQGGPSAWSTSGARHSVDDYVGANSVAWDLNKDLQAVHSLTRFPTDQFGDGNVRIFSPDIMALLVAAKAQDKVVTLRWRMENDFANDTIYFAARWDEYTGTAEQYENYTHLHAPRLLFI